MRPPVNCSPHGATRVTIFTIFCCVQNQSETSYQLLTARFYQGETISCRQKQNESETSCPLLTAWCNQRETISSCQKLNQSEPSCQLLSARCNHSYDLLLSETEPERALLSAIQWMVITWGRRPLVVRKRTRVRPPVSYSLDGDNRARRSVLVRNRTRVRPPVG